MIPEAHRDAVTDALRAAFGVTAPDVIRPLTEGMSASLLYRVDIRERAYALRIHHLRAGVAAPTRFFAYMQQAADAGIAPRVRYANEVDRIVITDFVERRPFPEDMAAPLASVLRRLHALPPFHASVDQLAVFGKLVATFGAFPVGDLLDRYAEIEAVYPRGFDHVSSHHDLKPENLAFDGERLLVLDWEAAFLDDRNFDLVVPACFFVRDDATLERYLTLYYGAPPTVGQRARFELVRIVEHVFYAVFLAALAQRGGAADDGALAEDFHAFHDALLGGLIVREPMQQLRYAKVHAAEGLRRAHAPAFVDWLSRARD